MRGSLIRRVRHWIANRGWRGFFAELLRRIRLRLSGKTEAAAHPRKQLKVHPFDQRYGVDTGGLIWGERLDLQSGDAYWATGYYGVSPSVFWQAMDRLALPWPNYTFVDIGCGKGRALMLALRYPLRRVLGVELSPELAAVAHNNLERFHAAWRTHTPAAAIAGNATTFDLPSGPLVVYLYHPFAAPVMKQFLLRLQASLEREPRDIYLLYTNPELDGLLQSSPVLTRLWEEHFSMAGEDVAADLFSSRYEHMVAYRSRANNSSHHEPS